MRRARSCAGCRIMSRSRFARGVAATVLLASIAACGRSTTPGSPSPPAAYPNISIVGVTVAGERTAGGYVYRVVATMRETAGVAATIAAVDLTFLKGTTVVVSSHEDRPISDSSNICPGGATVATRELIARDTSAHEFADVVRVAVSYADAGSFSAIANSSAAVPPLPAPPEPTVHTLSGFINDFDSRLPIANARVEGTEREQCRKGFNDRRGRRISADRFDGGDVPDARVR